MIASLCPECGHNLNLHFQMPLDNNGYCMTCAMRVLYENAKVDLQEILKAITAIEDTMGTVGNFNFQDPE